MRFIVWKAALLVCQQRPGPRCSNHARTRLNEARDTKVSAECALEAFEADPAPRPGMVPPDEYAQWRETRLALRVAATNADKDYSTALREMEATPAGMKALEEAIAIVGVDSDEGQAMTASLDAARALRSFQLGELRASRAYEQRLAHPSAGEQAVLDQSQARVSAAEHRLSDAETVLVAATHRSQQLHAVDSENRLNQNRAEDALAAVSAVAETARDEAEAEMVRLYEAEGVNARFAHFYARDTLVAATRPTGAPWRRNEDPELVLRRTPVLKTKASGADADATLRAKNEAETDSAYAVALSRWGNASRGVHAAREEAHEASARITHPNEERREVRNALRNAQAEFHQATAGVVAASDAHRDVLARHGSGLSTRPVTEVSLAHAGDEFKRNPDGTTNAYVYMSPTDGFEHGRYVRVSGVTSTHGMAEVNALVMDTGEKAVLSGHYGRLGGGSARETRVGHSVAYIVPAHEGAVPLRSENRADRGFYAFVDSTD